MQSNSITDISVDWIFIIIFKLSFLCNLSKGFWAEPEISNKYLLFCFNIQWSNIYTNELLNSSNFSSINFKLFIYILAIGVSPITLIFFWEVKLNLGFAFICLIFFVSVSTVQKNSYFESVYIFIKLQFPSNSFDDNNLIFELYETEIGNIKLLEKIVFFTGKK